MAQKNTGFTIVTLGPLMVLAVLFVVQLVLDLHLSYAPTWLAAANSLFLPLGAVPLAALAAIGVLRTGRPQLAWLGAGVIVLALAVVLSNLVGNPISLDTGVKTQNLGVLLAGTAHFTGAVATFSSRRSVEVTRQRRLVTLVATYVGAIVVTISIAVLSAAQVLPVFFVQGEGGTSLRQAVLTLAIVLFAGSALLSQLVYHQGFRSSFLYVYGWGLALVGLGQFAYLFAASIGDAMSWLGRAGQWGGAGYFLLACVLLVREPRTSSAGFLEALESLFPSAAEGYKLLIEASADPVVGVDAAGRVLIWSRAAEKMFAYRSDEAVGRPLEELTGIRVRAGVEGSMEEGESFLKNRDGVGFWARIAVANGGSSKSPMAAVVISNITERKLAEEEREGLRDEAQRYAAELDAAMDAIPDIVTLYDREGRVVRVNKSGQALGRLSPSTSSPFTPDEQTQLEFESPQGEDLGPGELPSVRALRGETVLGFTWSARLADSTLRHFRGGAAPIKDAEGRIVGAIGISTEITELVELHAEHERLLQSEQDARLRAEAAVHARDDFISVAAHELKTPVTSLRGFAQAILREQQKRGAVEPERLTRALVVIDQQTDKLSKLVTQLLDLSRLEAGRLILARQHVDMVRLVEEVAAGARLHAVNHTLLVAAPAPAEAFVDPIRVEQVVTNLVDNAIRYSPGGGVVEIVVIKGDGVVTVAVRDRGIGIPPEHLPHVFDRFYRAHEGGSIAGLGLGLYISKEIVTLHGGHIAVECPAGGGSRFIVVLPTGDHNPAESRG